MISFIIPTLNEERVLEHVLRNLATYSGECEIIVSDGRSSDRTIAIAKEHGARVVVYEGTARQTIANGRNLGAAAAQGEYLVFVDADVLFYNPDEFFARALGFFAADPNLVALTVRLKVVSDVETTPDRIIFACLNYFHWFLNNALKVGVSAGEFQMMRAAALKKIGGYNEKLVASEDYDCFARLGKIGRTRYEHSLIAYHLGRRAHRIGWPRLLFQWFGNSVSFWIFNRSMSKEWKEIR